MSLVPAALALIPAPDLAMRPIAPIDGAFLAGRKPATLRAYSTDPADFARFMRQPSAAAGVEALVSLEPGQANACTLGYRAHLLALFGRSTPAPVHRPALRAMAWHSSCASSAAGPA